MINKITPFKRNGLLLCILLFLFSNTTGQVPQFPQVYYNGQGAGGFSLFIHQSASLSSANITSLSSTSKIGVDNIVTSSEPSYGPATWARVCLPSTTGTLKYGYILYGQFYARINETNRYATVTATSLNIRPCSGCTSSNVTIAGSNAMFGQNSIVALTTGTSVNGWYEVYLTTDCSQATGWVSGTFLNINNSISNYYNIGGTVNNNNLVSIWGANVNIGGTVVNSTEGFYQYKLPIGWSGTISCTHSSYNTSTPTSYFHVANSHNYLSNFVLSNACPVPSVPTNLTIISTSPTSVSLSWSQVSGTGITYEVLKNNTSCGFVFGSSGFTTAVTNGTVTGLSPNTPYYFTVIARNVCGASGNSNCVSTTTPDLVQPPIANFTANKSIILINEQVQFFDLSSNATSWNWEFARESPLGNYAVTATSNQPNPAITFNSHGSYRVRLTALNSVGQSTKTEASYIYVKPDPTSPIPAAVAQSIKNHTYYAADPVNSALGYFVFSQSDLGTAGRKTQISVDRIYTSNPNGLNSFGDGWFFEYDKYLVSGEWQTRFYKGDGSYIDFEMYANGKMESRVPSLDDSMTYTINAGLFTYTYYEKNGNKWIFDDNGLLIKKIDLDGNTTQIQRVGFKISKIILPGGRELTFTSGAGGYSSITNSIDTAYYYYNATGLLDSVKIRQSRMWYKYNAANKLEEIISPNDTRIIKNEYTGDKVTKQWDAFNNLTEMQYNVPGSGYTTIINPAGKSKIVKHNASYLITEVKNESGQTKRFVQTPNHRIDSIIDERGNGHKFYTDIQGNVYKTTDPLGNSDTIGFAAFSKPAYIRDKEGNAKTITYSPTLNPATITLPNTGVIQIKQDQFGQDTAVIDPLGYVVKKRYSDIGDLTKVIRTYTSDSLVYDAIGRPIAHINGNGFADSIFYNHYNQPIRVVDQLGYTELFEYDNNGNLIRHTNKRNIVTNLSYDAKDRLVKVEKTGVIIKEYVWDALDYLVRLRDANKNCTIITNDDLGRPIMIADSVLGTLAEYGYDAAGNRIVYKNSLGNQWLSRFDELNRLVAVKNPLGDSTRIVYNKNSQPVEYIDEMGKYIKQSYNSLGLVDKVTDKNLNPVLISHDLKGLPERVQDARGFYRNMTYDEEGRLKTYDEGYGVHRYFYDGASNVTKHIQPNAQVLEWAYNPRNETTSESWNGTVAKSFGYTEDGLLNKALTTAGGNHHRVFNDLGYLIKDSATFGGATLYERDNNGNATKTMLPDGKEIKYNFNSLNTCTQVSDWVNRIVTINRDKEGNPTAYIFPNGLRTDIQRNSAYQITGWVNSRFSPYVNILQSNKPTYSKRGEVVTDTASINFYPTNPSTALVNAASYGAADRRQTYGGLSFTNDANGNVTNITGPGINNTYTYNPDNSTATLSQYGLNLSFGYNALGHRIRKTTLGGDTRYTLGYGFANYPVVLQETNNANAVTATNLFTPDGVLLARDSAGEMGYYQHTLYGNTSLISNALGSVTNIYAYSLFGDYVNQIGTSTQPYTWQGMYGVQKDAKDLYYLWARLYNAQTGSFLSKDPVQGGIAGPRSINPYLYGLNDPVSYGDPTGLYPQNTNTNALNTFLDYSGHILEAALSKLNKINIGSNSIVYLARQSGNIFHGNQYVSITKATQFANELTTLSRGVGGVNLVIGLNNIAKGFVADGYRPGANTILETAGFVGGWAGGIAGAKVGGSIGALFGPVGAIIGAGVGGVIGSTIGEKVLKDFVNKKLKR